MTRMTPFVQKFVLHCGEMSAYWGISRTVAQIHALLYVSPDPMPADEISETLMVARSNVSTGLKELQRWNVVRMVHVLGERRHHFESLRDPWEMFRNVVQERRRRDIAPTLDVLRAFVDEARQSDDAGAETHARLAQLADLLETTNLWLDYMTTVPPATLGKISKLGGRLERLPERAGERKPVASPSSPREAPAAHPLK